MNEWREGRREGRAFLAEETNMAFSRMVDSRLNHMKLLMFDYIFLSNNFIASSLIWLIQGKGRGAAGEA